MISLKPQNLSRYKDIAALFLKYGRSNIVRGSILSDEIGEIDLDNWTDDGKPEQLARDFERLGPAFIKLGQLLSTRPDFLPQPYLDAFARLQDDNEPIPFGQVHKVIEEELGVSLSKIFPEFDEKPLATASLGQVHRGSLRDGRQIVVKVQRPGVRARLDKDLEALTELADAISKYSEFGRRYQLTQIIATLRQTLVRELDYRTEAQNARILSHNLTGFKRLVVPKPIDDFVTSRVLTMEYLSGVKITDVSPAVLIELDREELADDLFQAYLHQVLVDGIFHADPHPGNLSLTRDNRIGLLDFGMVVRIPPGLQRNLVKLLLAISEGRGDDAARIAEEIGEKENDFNAPDFTRRIQTIVGENQDSTLERLNAGRVILYIQKAAGETGIMLPNEVVMIGKTLMNLDKVVSTLNPQFNPNEALRRHATSIIQGHQYRNVSLSTLYQSLMEASEFAQEMPRRLNQITRLVAENRLKVDVNAIDEAKLIRGLHRVANRITAGLVTAALIIGASLIMRQETEWKIFGYPAIALVFFIISAVAGGALLNKAMFQDPEDEK
jgi:ubiquinone biosynthesis protein